MKTIIFNYQVKIDNKIVKTAAEIITAQTLDIALCKMHERRKIIEEQYKTPSPKRMQVSCEINKIKEISR